jgi:hypothetical protein
MNGDENSQLTKTMNSAKGMLPNMGNMNGSSIPKMPSMPSVTNFPGIPASMKI